MTTTEYSKDDEIARLTKRIQELERRPPMSCVSCEEHNEQLANKLDLYTESNESEDRKYQALTAFLAGADVDLLDALNDKIDPEIMKKFERYWEGYNIFEEAEKLKIVSLRWFERLALSTMRDRTEDRFVHRIIDKLTEPL